MPPRCSGASCWRAWTSRRASRRWPTCGSAPSTARPASTPSMISTPPSPSPAPAAPRRSAACAPRWAGRRPGATTTRAWCARSPCRPARARSPTVSGATPKRRRRCSPCATAPRPSAAAMRSATSSRSRWCTRRGAPATPRSPAITRTSAWCTSRRAPGGTAWPRPARTTIGAPMLIDFFLKLKSHKLPVSIKEYLTLLEAMHKGVIGPSVDDFYYLSRAALVKDETNFDKFDRAFAEFWQGVETIPGIEAQIPLEWLLKQVELTLSEEEKKQIQALGGWEKLMETLRQRLEEQKGRHQGGSKWIGTGGTSPFGAYGYHPEGVRIGQEKGRNRSAVKVWDQREYRNLDDSVELGTRNIKVALRRLRKFAREGAPDEFDLDTTINQTARKAYLDIHMRPERRNAIKVLMLMDIGGTMDEHVRLAEELFSAAKTEFKHLEFFYFHNCLYDFVWKDNRRRHSERTRTWDLLHKYGHDYKVIFVGDATMSPYEILQPGGSIEYFNEEPGAAWIRRVTDIYAKCVWLNPEPEEIWSYRQSIGVIKELMNGRMYPTTLVGLERAMKVLAK